MHQWCPSPVVLHLRVGAVFYQIPYQRGILVVHGPDKQGSTTVESLGLRNVRAGFKKQLHDVGTAISDRRAQRRESPEVLYLERRSGLDQQACDFGGIPSRRPHQGGPPEFVLCVQSRPVFHKLPSDTVASLLGRQDQGCIPVPVSGIGAGALLKQRSNDFQVTRLGGQ